MLLLCKLAFEIHNVFHFQHTHSLIHDGSILACSITHNGVDKGTMIVGPNYDLLRLFCQPFLTIPSHSSQLEFPIRLTFPRSESRYNTYFARESLELDLSSSFDSSSTFDSMDAGLLTFASSIFSLPLRLLDSSQFHRPTLHPS
jgi:hypothetical protein